MSRYIKVKPHMAVKELDQMIKSVKGLWKVQQILVIRNAINKRKTSKELSEIINLSSHTIVKLVQKYNKEGKTFFDRKGKGGRKYGYMSLEQEKDFLEQCQKKAITGNYTTINDIQKAFEQKIGKKVAKSTIYRLLKRHNWRKLTTRPSHPKKNIEEQNFFKKNSIGK